MVYVKNLFSAPLPITNKKKLSEILPSYEQSQSGHQFSNMLIPTFLEKERVIPGILHSSLFTDFHQQATSGYMSGIQKERRSSWLSEKYVNPPCVCVLLLNN